MNTVATYIFNKREKNHPMNRTESRANLAASFKIESQACLKVVVTEAMSYIARSLAYRLLSDEIFGCDREIALCLFDATDSSIFLESVAIEITACAPNLLEDIIYSSDPSIAFKDADIIFSVGKSRDYNFAQSDPHSDPFFIDSVLETKNTAIAIEKYAKKDARVITLGNTAARIISEYAPSISKENISAVSLVLQELTASSITLLAQIAKKTNRLPCDVKNLIIWGTNSKHAFPYCRHARFGDGKSVLEEINDDEWCKKTLLKLLEGIFRKSRYRLSEALALADHCKFLVRGTPETEWTCMSVVSDGSYDVPPGIFFSFPVRCRHGQWEIVRDLYVDDYCKDVIKDILVAVNERVEAALKICREPDTRDKRISTRKSIIKLT